MEKPVTDYEVGQDNITPFGLDIHNPVFLISGLVRGGICHPDLDVPGSGYCIFPMAQTGDYNHF